MKNLTNFNCPDILISKKCNVPYKKQKKKKRHKKKESWTILRNIAVSIANSDFPFWPGLFPE